MIGMIYYYIGNSLSFKRDTPYYVNGIETNKCVHFHFESEHGYRNFIVTYDNLCDFISKDQYEIFIQRNKKIDYLFK